MAGIRLALVGMSGLSGFSYSGLLGFLSILCHVLDVVYCKHVPHTRSSRDRTSVQSNGCCSAYVNAGADTPPRLRQVRGRREYPVEFGLDYKRLGTIIERTERSEYLKHCPSARQVAYRDSISSQTEYGAFRGVSRSVYP
jgi:hypothetical protein